MSEHWLTPPASLREAPSPGGEGKAAPLFSSTFEGEVAANRPEGVAEPILSEVISTAFRRQRIAAAQFSSVTTRFT